MDGDLVYLDTSGVLAFLNLDDSCHKAARKAWRVVLEQDLTLVMTDYLRLEAWSLIQNRLGLEAVADFKTHILPSCRIEIVGEQGFEILNRQVLLGRRRNLSLVDLSSFDCMERLKITQAIAFDHHFTEHGYCLPK
jgi:predicted nucleic acid-binding protein